MGETWQSLCSHRDTRAGEQGAKGQDSWKELLPPGAGFAVWGLQREITNTLNH